MSIYCQKNVKKQKNIVDIISWSKLQDILPFVADLYPL